MARDLPFPEHMKILGILLVIFGVLSLVYGGFSFLNNRHVVDLGPLKLSSQWQTGDRIPPVVGFAALFTGGVLLVSTRRRHA